MKPTVEQAHTLLKSKVTDDSHKAYSLEDVLEAESSSLLCPVPLEGVIDLIDFQNNEIRVNFIFRGKRYQSVQAKTQISLNEVDQKKNCMLIFIGGNLDKPVISGLLMDLRESRSHTLIESDQSITIRSGAAEIILDDDSVEIRGDFVSTEASFVNKVSGGAVKIN